MNKPTGIVTFLFTDIEGSTKLSQDYPDTLQNALEKHHSILNKAIESNNGFVFEIVGDAFCCAFEKAEDAVKAAVDAQLSLSKEKCLPAGQAGEDAEIKVRIGIHSGNAEWSSKRYTGYITLARTARVMSAAYGEQIIISNNTYELTKGKFDAVNEKNIFFRDLGERRLKDVIQPIRLFQIESPGLREDFPSLKTLDARPNNLPIQLTSFIGREEVIMELKKLFLQTRLLTIIGSGGAGKTRLAMQVGAEMIDDFSSGVFITELAPVNDPSSVVQTVMNSFEVKEEPGRLLHETLTAFLKDKEMLIILDNCEHLIYECAGLAEMLLSKCPKLKIITSSREALNCRGELTYRLPSLTLPDISVINTPEQLTQYESVRLFIERAVAVNQTFRVNNDNAPALAQICYQLDGIPLAIELAAVRIKVLSVEHIFDRLKNRFKLLTGGKRTALPRQQTLKALIDWSYDLLSEKEKILMNRISVFAGGWTLESAEEICSDEKITKEEVLDLLNQLTEKSIIIYDEAQDRFRILETIKQYGEEKLRDSNQSEKILLKHLNYFLEYSESTESKLEGSEAQIWLEKLEAEHNNFQFAIEWSIKNGFRESGARISGALGDYWYIRGHYSTGRGLLERILDNAADISKNSLANILNWAGKLATHQGENEIAQKYCERSLVLRRGLGDESGVAKTLNSLGILQFTKSNFEEAKKFYEESLLISFKLIDKNGIASSLYNLGKVEKVLGDFEPAKNHLNKCYSLYLEIGNKRGIADSLYSLGNLAYEQEKFDQAQKYFDESLGLRREMGNKRGIAETLNNLGSLASDMGNYEQAKSYFEQGLALRLELGEKRDIAGSLYNLGIVTAEAQDDSYELAKKYYAESLSIKTELEDKRGIAEALNSSGILEFNNGNYEPAQEFLNEANVLSREIGDKNLIGNTLISLGNLAYIQEDFEKAAEFYKESLSLFRRLAVNTGIVESLLGLTGIICEGKHFFEAMKLIGAVETALKTYSIVFQRSEQRLHEQIFKKLHEKLSEKEFSKYLEEGKKLTLEQAYQLAANR